MVKKAASESKTQEIAPWINSRKRRAVEPTKVWEMTAETKQPEQPRPSSRKHTIMAVVAVAALFAVCAGIGAYAGGTAARQVKTHTVKPGETLWDIAKQSVGEEQDARKVYYQIMEDNGISEDATIQPGQQLIIKF